MRGQVEEEAQHLQGSKLSRLSVPILVLRSLLLRQGLVMCRRRRWGGIVVKGDFNKSSKQSLA